MSLELITSYILWLEVNRNQMQSKIIWTTLFLISLCLQLLSCGYPETPMEKLGGPNDKVELVFFYKKTASYEEKQFFENNILHENRQDGKGYYSREGVSGEFFVRNSDFEGYAIEFSTKATLQQRQNLKKAIEQSPIVYKVYEDVVPNQIKDL
jgi:hypothetical protein